MKSGAVIQDWYPGKLGDENDYDDYVDGNGGLRHKSSIDWRLCDGFDSSKVSLHDILCPTTVTLSPSSTAIVNGGKYH